MRTILSIDIGTHNVHMVEGYGQKDRVTVTKFRTFAIPAESRKGEMITDIPLFAETLKEQIRAGGFQSKEVVITINAIQAVVRDIDLPDSKPRELAGMVGAEMRSTFHVPEDDVIQFKELYALKTAGGEKLKRYRAVSFNRDIVRSYHEVLSHAKLKPVAMDINLNAIDKLMDGMVNINDRLIGEEAIMLIDFGHASTSIFIAAKDNELFYRHLSYGSGEIDQIISDEFLSKPEEVKSEKERGESFFSGTEQADRYYAALKPYFYRFNDEIRKVIGFYNSRTGVSAISTAYVFGEGSYMNGLCEYWESGLGIPVAQIKTISKLDRQSTPDEIAPYLNAIGALIRY